MNLSKLTCTQLSFLAAAALTAWGWAAQTAVAASANESGVSASHGNRTPLDEYVAKPDTNFSYKLVKKIPGAAGTAYILEMTSQAWLTTNEVDRPIWKHWLTIVKPDTVTSSTALLFIGGGRNDGKVPNGPDGMTAQIASRTKSITAELRMIPNQPLVFAGESQGRFEDSLIAYTWDKFLRTGDAKWPARLPMTKAAVRAMDTMTSFCGSSEAGNVQVDRFVVAGGSKRGWTTWTTAAVDKRVVAIVPCVIDLLNIVPSMMHHYAAYGFWAPAIHDYEEFKIMEWNGTPEYTALMKIVEPYEYRHRLTMPKFIINAAGDQFFLPDSSQFYFNDLPGVKYLRYVPNTDHSLKNSDAPESMLACYNAVLRNDPLPRFSWTNEPNQILVTAQDKPSEVKVWQATNPDTRDFRLEVLGPKYTSTTLVGEGGVYRAELIKPEKGWTAYFVELTFPSSAGVPFKFTTDVRVVPDVLPHKFVSEGPPRK